MNRAIRDALLLAYLALNAIRFGWLWPRALYAAGRVWWGIYGVKKGAV